MKTQFALAVTLAMTGGAMAQDAFANAIRPITAPTVVDLALPRTQLHAIYLNQSMPSTVSTTLGQVPIGGDFQVYALQFEIVLNERTSIVATKDGYIDFNPDATVTSQSGFADLGLGIKRALIYDPQNGRVVSGIATIGIPTGDSEVWQGVGDGALNLSLAGLQMRDQLQLAGNASLHIPFSDSQSLTGSVNLHASYEVTPLFIPLVELNWFHVFDPGDGSSSFTNQGGNLVPSVAQFEAGDLINWGSANADQNRDVVTLGVGFRSKLTENLRFGAAYEFPLTTEEDNLMEDRVTLDLVWIF